MGNVLSCACATCEHTYDKYYPKCKYLEPKYVASTLMAASIARNVLKNHGPVNSELAKCLNFNFMACTGASLGIQLWVYFVNGFTMMKILPRHQFGQVQAQLYPKFFFLSSLFSFGSLTCFLKYNNLPLTASMKPLGICLATSFALNIINFTCFNPNAIKYNQKMHEIERNAGEGLTTVGKLMQDAQCESDPEYIQAKKKFYRFHGYSVVAGFASLGCTIAEFYLLSNQSFFGN